MAIVLLFENLWHKYNKKYGTTAIFVEIKFILLELRIQQTEFRRQEKRT
jgi:hypothetical protein